MRVCGLLSNFLCSHFLSSCPNIQGLDISGCLCQNSSQTRRFYTCYVQCVSSLLPLFITWPPLWLSEDGADWQLILSGLTFIPLSCVSPGAPFPRKKNREDFHIVQLTYFSLCPSSMGATPKSGWMLQVSQEHVTNLTEFFIKKPLCCQEGSGELSFGPACGCVLICWLQRLFKLTSYFQKEQTHSCLNTAILVQQYKTWQAASYLLCAKQSSTKPQGWVLFKEFAINFSDQLDGNSLKV